MEEKNLLGNIESFEKEGNIFLKSDSTPFATSFYFCDVYDEKNFKKFVKNTERIIRMSKEYNKYIELLRTNVTQLNHDNILHNITTSDVELEFHHYPLSLYDIVEISATYLIYENKNFTSLSLAKYVMEQHYKHNIGLVPLTSMTHKLAHDGDIFLSSKQVFGNYKNFIEIHSKAITPELAKKINDMEDMTEAGFLSDYKGLL